eukprot:gene13458-13573_t
MKNILFVGVALTALTAGLSAQAADLPNRKQAPMVAAYVAPAAFSWTGFYVGANAGYGTGSFTKGGKAAEYAYTALGSKNYFSGTDTTPTGLHYSTVRAGINYHF